MTAWPKPDGFVKRVINIGVFIAVLGAMCNRFVGYLSGDLSDFAASGYWSIATLCTVLVGLLITFYGGVIWALSVDRLNSLVLWGIVIATVAFVMLEAFDVRLLSSTAIFLLFFYAAEVTAAFILIIAAIRLRLETFRNPRVSLRIIFMSRG
jgi:hypothetical protein